MTSAQQTELLDALKAPTREYHRTKKAHEKARDETVAAVLNALRAGVPPTKVVAACPFSPAYVRKLARDHEIPAP